jgi:glucan biosynthesis protein C
MSALRTEAPAATKQGRLLYLDWLRVLAVLGVFYYHTLRPFDATSDWNVKNTDLSLVATFFVAFFSTWGIPLLFLVAGAASWFALRSRSRRQFLGERSLRLLLPLFVGFLLLSPPQAYVEAFTHGRFAGSFFQFVPWFFTHIQPSWHIVWIGTYAYHLWFLAFLWLYSLLALPLFVFLRGAAGSRVLDKLAAWCSRPGGIFLFVLPIAIIQMALRAAFPVYPDWADFTFWFAFFVYGYLLFSRPSFTEAIRRQGWFALGIAILCELVIFALSFGRFWPWDIPLGYTPIFLFFQLLFSIHTWAWLVFILSCGIRWLNHSSKVLPYANEAVLPFYVLQQPAVIVIAFYVVQWDMAVGLKWLILSTLALALILAVYELLIRRVNAMRWLFGMKPRQRTPREDRNGREQEGHKAEAPTGKAEQPILVHTWKEDPSDFGRSKNSVVQERMTNHAP